jgi:hypothetical protein
MFVSWFFYVILLCLIIAAVKVGECTYIINKLPVNIFKMTGNKNLRAHRSLDCRRPRTNYKPSDASSCASQTHSLSCCSSPLLTSCARRWQQWVASAEALGERELRPRFVRWDTFCMESWPEQNYIPGTEAWLGKNKHIPDRIGTRLRTLWNSKLET